MSAIHPRDRDGNPDDFPKIKTSISYEAQICSLIRQQIRRSMPDSPAQGCSYISAGDFTRAESGDRDNYIEYKKSRGDLSNHGLIRLDVNSKLDYDDRLKLFRLVCRCLHINNVRHSWGQSVYDSISVWTDGDYWSRKNLDNNHWLVGDDGGVCYHNIQWDKKAKDWVRDADGETVYRKGERQIKPLFADVGGL